MEVIKGERSDVRSTCFAALVIACHLVKPPKGIPQDRLDDILADDEIARGVREMINANTAA